MCKRSFDCSLTSQMTKIVALWFVIASCWGNCLESHCSSSALLLFYCRNLWVFCTLALSDSIRFPLFRLLYLFTVCLISFTTFVIAPNQFGQNIWGRECDITNKFMGDPRDDLRKILSSRGQEISACTQSPAPHHKAQRIRNWTQ